MLVGVSVLVVLVGCPVLVGAQCSAGSAGSAASAGRLLVVLSAVLVGCQCW